MCGEYALAVTPWQVETPTINSWIDSFGRLRVGYSIVFGEAYDRTVYWFTFITTPSHGVLYKCTTIDCREYSNTPLNITDRFYVYDLHTPVFVYVSEYDYSNDASGSYDTFHIAIFRQHYGSVWTVPNMVSTATYNMRVLQMPSMPLINSTTVYDPDGTSVVQHYGIHLDNCTATTDSGFNGICVGQDCQFSATSLTFHDQLSKIRCGDKRTRGYVVIRDKPLYSAFCSQFIQNAALGSSYVNIGRTLPTINNSVHYEDYVSGGGRSTYTLLQNYSPLGYFELSHDRNLSYVLYDDTSFNAVDPVDCIPANYTITDIVLSINTSTFNSPDVKWQVCVSEVQRYPHIFNVSVRNVWKNMRIPFFLDVADFNDGTFGVDDGKYSKYAFRRDTRNMKWWESELDDYSGVIFAQTNFSHSQILLEDCVTPAEPDVTYHSLKYCYLATDDETPFEATAVIAVDNNYNLSNFAYVEFEAAVGVAVCDASGSPAHWDNDCTSKGMESNSKFGTHDIAIMFQTYVFPAQIHYEMVIIVEKLPEYGTLYECFGLNCSSISTNPVSIGRRIKFVAPEVPTMWYRGDQDYFNFAVFSMIGNSNTLEDFPVVLDRKGLPFRSCTNDTTNGCPDTFTFRYEHVQYSGANGTGTYNIFVQNRGSNVEFGKRPEPPVTRRNPYQYANRYDTNIPYRVGQPYFDHRLHDWVSNPLYYNDPDGDTWEAELLVTTTQAYVGDVSKAVKNYNLELYNVDMDCKNESDAYGNTTNDIKYCGGTYVLRGMPSDIKKYVENDVWFYFWPSYFANETTQPIYFSLSKRYAIVTFTAENIIAVANRDVLQEAEDAVNNCAARDASNASALQLFSYRGLFSDYPPMRLDATRVQIYGYFGESTLSINGPLLESVTNVDPLNCQLVNKSLALTAVLIKDISSKLSAYPEYYGALLYEFYGPGSIEPIAVRRTYNNYSIDLYTVSTQPVEYIFMWNGWRGAKYQPLSVLPPSPPSVSFWVMIGDSLFSGAISNPTPENIALACLNIFLLFVPFPIPPIGLMVQNAMRQIVKIGQNLRLSSMAPVLVALTIAARLGLRRMSTSNVKTTQFTGVFSSSSKFVYGVTKGARFSKIMRAITLGARSAFKSRIASNIANLPKRAISRLQQLTARFGTRFSRPSLNGIRLPRIPPKPIKNVRQLRNSDSVTDLRPPPPKFDSKLTKFTGTVKTLFTNGARRLSTIKGGILKKFANQLSKRLSSLKRGLRKRSSQIKAKIKKLRRKKQNKTTKRTKKGRTKKQRDRRKKRDKRKKDKKVRLKKNRGRGIPRIRSRKTKLKSLNKKKKNKWLPFDRLWDAMKRVVGWILYLAYLACAATYYASSYFWEAVFFCIGEGGSEEEGEGESGSEEELEDSEGEEDELESGSRRWL